jgi:hypothetical protein
MHENTIDTHKSKRAELSPPAFSPDHFVFFSKKAVFAVRATLLQDGKMSKMHFWHENIPFGTAC